MGGLGRDGSVRGSEEEGGFSWDPVGAGSPLLPALPGAGSTTSVAAGGSLIFLVLGSADSSFLEGVASRSWIFEQSNK